MTQKSSDISLELEDLFPLSEELQDAFEHIGDESAADAWLSENDIDSETLKAAGITCRIVNVTASNDFDVLAGQSRGGVLYEITDGGLPVLGVPIMAAGEFVDLCLIDLNDPTSFRCMYERSDWLGSDHLGQPTVRLHRSPLSWLEAAGVGVANLHPYCRQHFKDLSKSDRIECDDIDAALEAWEWGFSARAVDLTRIDCDDTPENIAAYFDRQAFWSASAQVREAA